MDETRGVINEKKKQTNHDITVHWCYTNGNSYAYWYQTNTGEKGVC